MTVSTWRPWDASRDAVRASDADREAAADTLHTHYSAGRLTDDEFQNRLERSMAAKTLGELRALVTDLPDRRSIRTRPDWMEWLGNTPLVPVIVVAVFAFLAAIARPWHMPWHYGMFRPGHHHWYPLFVAVIVVWAVLSRRRSGSCHGGDPD